MSDHYPIEVDLAIPPEGGHAPVEVAPPVSNTIEGFAIAAFNVQVFGQTKSKKPEVMAVLVDVRTQQLISFYRSLLFTLDTNHHIYESGINNYNHCR